MLSSYLDINFKVIKKADKSRYGNGYDIWLVNLGPIAFISIFKLKNSSGNHLENINIILAHIVFLRYKFLTSSRGSDDISIGFDHSCNRRRGELTSNRNVKVKFLVRIMLKDVFGFVEHQEKTTYGLGYKLTLRRNEDDDVVDKTAGIADARFEIDHIHGCVPQHTPSIQQQSLLSNQILSKTPTELRYVERSVFMKEVNNQNMWNFIMGPKELLNVPIRTNIGFQQRDREDSQSLNDTFCRLPVHNAQCIIGLEKYPDAGIFLTFDHDDCTHGYNQIKE